MTTIIQEEVELSAQQVAEAKLQDAEVPGFIVSMDPDEAEMLGAFEEEALSGYAAMQSTVDAVEFSHE